MSREELLQIYGKEMALMAGFASSVTFYTQMLVGVRPISRTTLILSEHDGLDYVSELAARRWENGLRAAQIAEQLQAAGLQVRNIERYRHWVSGDFSEQEQKCLADKERGRTVTNRKAER